MANDYLDQLDEDRDLLAPSVEAEDLEPVAPQLIPTPESVAPTPVPHMSQASVGAPVPSLDVKGYGQGADAAALAKAEAARGDVDRNAMLQDAMHSFNAAFGGNLPSTADATRATRNDSFQDVMRRRALSDQDLQRNKLQHDSAMTAALARSDSPEAVARKEKFFSSMVGRHMYELLGPEAAARLPGSAVPGDKEQLASDTQLMMAGMKAQARQGSAKHRLDTIVAAAGGPDSPKGQWFAQKFANATDEDLKFAEDLLKQDRSQENQNEQGRLGREAQIQGAKIAAGIGLAEKREKAVEGLGTDLKEGSGITPNMKTIDEVLARTKAAGSNDIPGVGPLDYLKNNILGGVLETNDEGKRLTKAAGQLELGFRNLVTGSAASEQEDKRIMNAGIDRRTDSGFRVGYETMKNRYRDLLERTYAKVDPRVAQIFVARNPNYAIPGHPRFDSGIAQKAAAVYEASSPLNTLQPALIEQLHSLERIKGPGLDTSAPVREPGGAPAPVQGGGEPKKYRNKVTGKIKLVYPDGREEEVTE